MIFILFAFRYHVHGAPSLLPVAESNFRWNVHFFHPPLMCPVPLRTVQLFPLFPCPPVSCSSDAALCTAPLCLCTYMSPCTSRSASPPILHARKLHSHAHSDKLMMARGEWVGGHEPKTAHCILTEWGIKSSLSFSISSAEMQSLDSSVTVLQGFENITRA